MLKGLHRILLVKGVLALGPWNLPLHCCKYFALCTVFIFVSANLWENHQNAETPSPAGLYSSWSAASLMLRDLGVIQGQGHGESQSVSCILPCPLGHCLVFRGTTPTVKVTQPERRQCKQGQRCQRDLLPSLGPWEEGGQPGSVSPEQSNAVMRNASPPACPGSHFCAHVKSQEESTPGHALWGSDLTRKHSAAVFSTPIPVSQNEDDRKPPPCTFRMGGAGAVGRGPCRGGGTHGAVASGLPPPL